MAGSEQDRDRYLHKDLHEYIVYEFVYTCCSHQYRASVKCEIFPLKKNVHVQYMEEKNVSEIAGLEDAKYSDILS